MRRNYVYLRMFRVFDFRRNFLFSIFMRMRNFYAIIRIQNNATHSTVLYESILKGSTVKPI